MTQVIVGDKVVWTGKDALVGPHGYKTAVATGDVVRVAAVSGNQLCVRTVSGSFFGWTSIENVAKLEEESNAVLHL